MKDPKTMKEAMAMIQALSERLEIVSEDLNEIIAIVNRLHVNGKKLTKLDTGLAKYDYNA
jgi:mevalonate kinase